MTKADLPKELDSRRAKIGMSRRALAVRAHVSLPTVNRILSGKETNPRFRSLDAIAQVLRVTVTFGPTCSVVPVEAAFDVRKKQAAQKAAIVVNMVQGTMGLEAQAVSQGALKEMLEQTIVELLAGPSRRLWSE